MREYYATVTVQYINKATPVKFNKITEVCYSTEKGEVTVTGEDIVKHKYPLNASYRLYGKGINTIIYSNIIGCISFDEDNRIYSYSDL